MKMLTRFNPQPSTNQNNVKDSTFEESHRLDRELSDPKNPPSKEESNPKRIHIFEVVDRAVHAEQ